MGPGTASIAPIAGGGRIQVPPGAPESRLITTAPDWNHELMASPHYLRLCAGGNGRFCLPIARDALSGSYTVVGQTVAISAHTLTLYQRLSIDEPLTSENSSVRFIQLPSRPRRCWPPPVAGRVRASMMRAARHDGERRG